MKKINHTIRKKFVIYVKKNSVQMTMIKKYYKVRDCCHYTGKCRGDAHNACNLRYKTPKEIPVVFDNGFKHDYPFKT